MTRKRTIQSALPIVAAAYGEKFGVKVAIGNDTAYTDGQTIVVPNIPEDYPHMDVLWGYLAHEAAHVRFTDFSVHREWGLHAELTNILEDCRIEQAMMRLYPGTRHSLNEVARYMLQAGHYEPVTEDNHPASILSGYILYWLQAKVVGQSVLDERLENAAAVVARVFPQGVVVRLNALLRKAAQITTTAQAASLATEIIKMIEDEKEKVEEQQQQQQSQPDQGQGEQSQQGDDSQDQPQAGDGDQGQGQGQDQQGQGSDAPSGQSSQAQGGDDQSQAPQQGSGAGNDGSGQDAAKLLQQVLDAEEDDLRGDAHDALKQELNQQARQDGDSNYRTARTAVETKNDPKTAEQLLRSVKGTTSKIRAQLYGLVQASQRVASRTERTGKRVDSRRLHRVVAGDSRVFRRPADKARPNTAVHILVDMSSSMIESASNGKQRQQIARESALAISLALDAIPGVNPAVTFFGYNQNQPVFSAIRHGERVQSRAGRFSLEASGTTPMAEAIWYAAFELSKTREERKMLIVVTDGEPDSTAACQAIIDLCEDSGIETIGIGVESTAVARLFDKHIVINDAAALQRTLFKLMERSLAANVA